jgi:twitching motility two-component system response regulator PilG
MVIDDSLTVRKIVETSLRRAGIQTWCYADGIEALGALTNPQHPIPDLLILDINLPKMNGYEIARKIKNKKQFNKVVIIMLTSKDGLIDRLKGRLSGAASYMTKPFRTQELLATISKYGELPIGIES